MCFLPSAEGQNKDFCKRVLKAATRQNDEAKSNRSSGTDEKDVLHLQIDGFFDWDGGGGGGMIELRYEPGESPLSDVLFDLDQSELLPCPDRLFSGEVSFSFSTLLPPFITGV